MLKGFANAVIMWDENHLWLTTGRKVSLVDACWDQKEEEKYLRKCLAFNHREWNFTAVSSICTRICVYTFLISASVKQSIDLSCSIFSWSRHVVEGYTRRSHLHHWSDWCCGSLWDSQCIVRDLMKWKEDYLLLVTFGFHPLISYFKLLRVTLTSFSWAGDHEEEGDAANSVAKSLLSSDKKHDVLLKNDYSKLTFQFPFCRWLYDVTWGK